MRSFGGFRAGFERFSSGFRTKFERVFLLLGQKRAVGVFLRILENAKLQISVIFDSQMQIFVIFHQNKGFLAYFADSGKRKIADFPAFFDQFGLPDNL